MAFSRWIQDVPWVVEVTGNARQISIVWLFHFLGYFLAVGTTSLVNLRILGLSAKRQSATKLAKLLFPWTWLGLLFVTLTGLIMFFGIAAQLYHTGAFRIKIVIFLLAILFGLIVQTRVAKWDQMPSMPAGAKVVAILSLMLWVGMILASVEVPAFTGV